MIEKTKVDRATVRADWDARGFTCELWVDAPGQVWTGFVHDVDEIVQVVDGQLLFEIGNRVLQLDPGDELVIPAGTRHTMRNSGAGPVRWLYGYRRATDAHSSSV